MRKLFAALLLFAFGVAVSPANPVTADVMEPEQFKLRNAKSKLSRASALGTSAISDTVFVGAGGAVTPANPWGIEAALGNQGGGAAKTGPGHKGGIFPARGMWAWEVPINGDSLQGWTPYRHIYFSYGAGRNDKVRPETCIDIGNNLNKGVANMTGTEAERRQTPGVIGLWHVDGGNTVGGAVAPSWAPLGGNSSAWMGARRDKDHSYLDPITGNPFNEESLKLSHFDQSGGALPTQSGFPGYGSQMDQFLYRDIDVSGDGGNDLTVSWDYRTNMSTNLVLDDPVNTLTGWFHLDWLAATDDGAGFPTVPGAFISGIDAGVAGSPIDSFMVYIGAPADDNAAWYTESPPPLLPGDNPRPVWDKQRRWFNEILDIGDVNVAPGGPPLWNGGTLWYELLSVAGDNAVTNESRVIPAATVAQMGGSGKVRLVFRVKTNRGGDDLTALSYSSGGAGAAVVDNVTYSFAGGSSSPAGWGDFENVGDIDNSVSVDPLNAWKSTGKPPRAYAHLENETNPTMVTMYKDICGSFGGPGRIADLGGNFISFGNHDVNDDFAGPESGAADYERNAGILSPVIDLSDLSDGNPHGFAADGLVGDRLADQDYVYLRELYTGDMSLFGSGHLWRFGCQVYPKVTDVTKGAYETWSPVRTAGFSYFNPQQQAFTIADGLRINSIFISDTPDQTPDSARVMTVHRTLCWNFGITNCEQSTDGFFLDNASLAIIDGTPVPMQVEIWHWIADTFPANEEDGKVDPGTAFANFDTLSAHLRTGLNIAPVDPGIGSRFSVPGDSTEIQAPGSDVRVDMVFRILPGVGNYVNIGHPEIANKLRLVPTSPTGVADAPSAMSTNFWESYLANNGAFGSPGGHPTVGPAKVWDPNVWNSARCDSEEVNVFPFNGRDLENLPSPGQYMSTYHEDDPKFPYLGIDKNRCFVATETAATNDLDCLTVPSYISAGGVGGTPGPPTNGYDGVQTTKEYTKILVDGQLTPGAHVQYFFRKSRVSTPAVLEATVPDTSTVFPQVLEANFDAHRWQGFAVLPDRWKDNNYIHPVTGQPGLGMACLLAVDYNDRRGNERPFISVMDTLGANLPARRGAHNGWAAPGNISNTGAVLSAGGGINSPAYRVAAHYGQAGSSFDFYQKKASESLTTGNGIGDRLSNRDAANTQMIGKVGRQGPTPKMLDTFYDMIFMMTGDLDTGTITPIENNSADDVALLDGWLGGTANKGFWVMGEGFAESVDPGTVQETFVINRMGAALRDGNFALNLNNASPADLELVGSLDAAAFPQFQGDVLGVRNTCLVLNDVIDIAAGPLSAEVEVVGEYEALGSGVPPDPALPFIAGLYKPFSAGTPWTTLLDGYEIENLTSRFDTDTQGRHRYFNNVFTSLFGTLCNPVGTPLIALNTPELQNGRMFFALGNNPLRSGQAKVHFGLTKSDRVTVKVYDVSGRLVRTLADRVFEGPKRHELVWDGLDNGGRQVARGVYFTQVKFLNSKFSAAKKLTVLK